MSINYDAAVLPRHYDSFSPFLTPLLSRPFIVSDVSLSPDDILVLFSSWKVLTPGATRFLGAIIFVEIALLSLSTSQTQCYSALEQPVGASQRANLEQYSLGVSP